ncbi:MAG TPA: hypothetical protein VKA46_18925 [Gemmataceae bacterium]|nr:hypothetical protein [Gemmataceae bacterium]
MIQPTPPTVQAPPPDRRAPVPDDVLPPFPRPHDFAGWANWWHRWARIGYVAGRLDPHGPLYEPVYPGDHTLPQRREPA